MKIKVLNESGHSEALLGVSLSYNKTPSPEAIITLSHKDGGHNKFLESIIVWIDITAPRYWWQQFDTYRVGVTKQSQSTMHTLKGHTFTRDDFETYVPAEIIDLLNRYKDEPELKGMLPEAFLQRRIVCTNYKTLRNIFKQRRSHRLVEWNIFISQMFANLEHNEYLEDCV